MYLDEMLDEIVVRNDVVSDDYKKYVTAKKRIAAEFEALDQQYSNVLIVALNVDDAAEFEKAVFRKKKISSSDYIFLDEYFENMDDVTERAKNSEAVLFISYCEHSYITWRLQKSLENVPVIDMYDWFEKEDLSFQAEFYKLGEYIHEIYKQTFSDKKKNDSAKDPKLKKRLMKKIIEDYIIIRDFVHVLQWVDTYLETYDDVCYCAFRKDIVGMLNDIKEALGQRKQHDIIIEWLDSLQKDEVGYMPRLDRLRNEEGLYLENSATVTPWTIPTMWTILQKKRAVDDHEFLLEKDRLDIDQSDLVNALKEKGYDFFYVGQDANLIFNGNAHMVQYYGVWDRFLPFNQWQAWQILLDHEQPCCILCQNVMETHFPNICPELDEYVHYFKNRRVANPQMKNNNIYVTTCGYIDEQLAFYLDALPEATKIYMSDHGKGTMFDRWRTVMIVDSKYGKKGIDRRPFSLINFDKLIYYFLDPDEDKYNGLFSEYVEIQDTDIYGWSYDMLATNPISIDHLLGYRGVCTAGLMYLKRNDGKKFLYQFPKKQNVIAEPEFAEAIEQFEEVIGDYQIDINQYDYFKMSRFIRKAIDCYYERLDATKEEIEQAVFFILADLPKDAVIAIRGGGEHTENLLRIIGDSLHITYIIDRKLSQINMHNAYQYLLPEEVADKEIDVVILSSYGHRKDMKKELEQNQKDYVIIDIYDELEKRGIILNQPFYGAELIEPQDFEKARSFFADSVSQLF